MSQQHRDYAQSVADHARDTAQLKRGQRGAAWGLWLAWFALWCWAFYVGGGA